MDQPFRSPEKHGAVVSLGRDPQLEREVIIHQFDYLHQREFSVNTRHFTVLRETVALTAAAFAAVFLVRDDRVPLVAFMLVFAVGVPVLALVAALTWVSDAKSGEDFRLELKLLQETYPRIEWPPTTAAHRVSGRMPTVRNRFNVLAAALVFPGLATGSVVLAIIRATNWGSSPKSTSPDWTYAVWAALIAGVLVTLAIVALFVFFYLEARKIKSRLY